ncbi:hypothetical protein [Nocardia niwae]|uniref:hypothetical protein n=1 Tax=Nocardia niwae TaxID=626084 RepID=UPI0012F50297|nr:hypothetical protein [Nocardia niwae]
MQINIIVPATSTGYVAEGLRLITRAIAAATGVPLDGGLGGEDGYGLNYDNDVFTMRPFYWGDCDCGSDQTDAEWCDNNPAVHEGHGYSKCANAGGCEWWDRYTAANLPDHDRERCSLYLPNFVYKPTGATAEWYKWIGRDLEFAGELPVDFAAVCIASLAEANT